MLRGPMELRPLVQAAARAIDAAFEEEVDSFFLTVHVQEAQSEDDDDRTQLVMVHADVEADVVVVTTDVGPYDDDIDLAEVLRLMRDSVMARVYIGEPAAAGEGELASDDDGVEPLVVEACLPRRGLDAEVLATAVQEVAEIADDLEVLLYDEPLED